MLRVWKYVPLFLIVLLAFPCTISHRIHKWHSYALSSATEVPGCGTELNTLLPTYPHMHIHIHTHTSTYTHTPQKSGRCVDSLLTFWNLSSQTQGPSRSSSEQGSMFNWSHFTFEHLFLPLSLIKTRCRSPTSHKDLCFHKRKTRTSPSGQLDGVSLPVQGTRVQSPVREDSPCWGADKLEYGSYWAHTHLSSRATTPEPVASTQLGLAI